jgi:hypothetical protein
MSYIIPELKLIGAPYVISSYDHLKAVVKGPYGKRMDAKFREKGMHLMDVWYEGTRHTTANKPINSMADLKGLKMRTPNVPFLIAYASAVGATPAPVAFAELYLALQTKQVDAQENPLPTIEATKVYEVQKHIALTGHFIASSAILVATRRSRSSTRSRSSGWTDAIAGRRQVCHGRRDGARGGACGGFKSKGLGVTRSDTAPFRAAMKPYYDTLEAELGSRRDPAHHGHQVMSTQTPSATGRLVHLGAGQRPIPGGHRQRGAAGGDDALILFQIASRLGFLAGQVWTEELIRWIWVWLAMLGGCEAERTTAAPAHGRCCLQPVERRSAGRCMPDRRLGRRARALHGLAGLARACCGPGTTSPSRCSCPTRCCTRRCRWVPCCGPCACSCGWPAAASPEAEPA